MNSMYAVLTVLPATELVSTEDELPVFTGEVGLQLAPRVRRGGDWMVIHGARYQHIRADPKIGEEWYGVDAESLHQLGWRSLHMVRVGESWTMMGFWSAGLYSDFGAVPGWRDVQTSAGAWFDRRFEHWTWGLGAMVVQRPGTFLPLPVISFSRKGDRLSLSGTLPTDLTILYEAGAFDLGLQSTARLGTYHLTSDASPDTYSAYTTLLAGPTARWTHEAWSLRADADWIPYRQFRKVVDDTVEVVEPARGWALNLRIDWKHPPPRSK